ncbi:MAG: tetratricopeptide repeat protein [Bacteroidota bacterium]|nr:tetratricopeptide repeat protein [Bacteroidota bacterium]
MKKPQWITIGAGIFLVAIIYLFGRTTPLKNTSNSTGKPGHPDEAINLADTILNLAKRQIKPDQVVRINTLENSISRGAVKDQQLKIYHQLAHFWLDSAGLFLPYAWYEGQGARLENSEKTLTFAARLFLDNLQTEQNAEFRRWEALQAKDLFERSLSINPGNDSAKVGLGACYLFGNISAAPMEGLAKINEVLNKDSTNVYAQMMLVKGALMTTQYDKALKRLQTINRLQPDNLEAILMLADVYERMNQKPNAVKWYQQSLLFVKQEDMKAAIEKRIEELEK